MSKNYFVLNWLDVAFQFINRQQYNIILKTLREDKNLREIGEKNFRRLAYFDNTFQVIEKRKDASELRIYKEGELIRYKYINSTQQTIDRVNENGKSPAEYFKMIDDAFKAQFGKTIFTAFSGRKYKDIYTAIKKCVPSPPNFALPSKKPYNGCFKSDVSSAYPWELSQDLPTLHGCKTIKGRVKPTEEFPFAFYLESHHIAIYNELDSRMFCTKFYEQYYVKKYNDFVPDDKEITILCKKSPYSFKDIMADFYAKRKTIPYAKDAMNITIGCFHYNLNPMEAHLAAVVLARCVNDMNKRAIQLEREKNKVILINTDCIIWKGKQSAISTPKAQKELGKFTVEEENIPVCVRSVKCYQFYHTLDNGKQIVVTKYAGDREHLTAELEFGYVLTLSDETIEKMFKTIKRIDGYYVEV